MKKIALITGLCAITSGAFAQSSSVVIIPAFQNRFGSIHQPVVALNTINTSSALETRNFGGSTYTSDPAARGIVSSPTASAAQRGRLDAGTMNIPVFPGNTVLMQQQAGFGFGAFPFGAFPNAGFGNTGFFIQQGSGTSLQQVDPFRTTATPGPAVNAVPDPAANAVPNPAAPVSTIPQLQVPTTSPPQVSPTPTIPVQQQNPATIVPGTPAQSAPAATGQNR
ncbi:MAG TPA: hypothetical protein VJ063_10875 [Verrucomicrobiae bacterium]|nr:hypothetical protein [Verrucomicrobiae bacterium]